MSLSSSTSRAPDAARSVGWLVRGRSAITLVALSALCGIGLAAAGMMLMRAADGAGVRDVVAGLGRNTGRSRPAVSSAATAVPLPTAAASPATMAPVAPEPVATASLATRSAAPVEAPPTPSAAPVPGDVAVLPTPAPSPPAKPSPAAKAVATPQPVTPPAAPAREALSPVKPQRARPEAADAKTAAKRTEAAKRLADVRDTAPPGLRAIAAPAGTAANVRAYTLAGPASGSESAAGYRVIRLDGLGAR